MRGFFHFVYFFDGGMEGGIYSGTLLLMAFSDLRKAKISSRSASFICPMACHGIGGMIGRPASAPMCLPERRIFLNDSAVQAPMPVAESGVRLRGKEVPHGPNHVVRSCEHIN